MRIQVNFTGFDTALKKAQKLIHTINSEDFKKFIAEKALNEINKIAQERLENSSNYIDNNKYTFTDTSIILYNGSTDENGFNYSLIIEYGSGTYAELPHIGTTEEFKKSGFEWWISGLGYKVTGQEPKHIYTDAVKVIQNSLPKWCKEYLQLAGFVAKEMK